MGLLMYVYCMDILWRKLKLALLSFMYLKVQKKLQAGLDSRLSSVLCYGKLQKGSVTSFPVSLDTGVTTWVVFDTNATINVHWYLEHTLEPKTDAGQCNH